MKLASVEEALAAKEKTLALLKRRTLGTDGDGPELITTLRQKLSFVETEVSVRKPDSPVPIKHLAQRPRAAAALSTPAIQPSSPSPDPLD